MTCEDCIHKSVCYRIDIVPSDDYADKCGDYILERTGHWITYDVHGHKACKCSECNMDVGYPCNDRFCKYCGARMK